VREQLLNQSELSGEDYYVLELVLENRLLSYEKVTMDDLKRAKVQEFSQILPILDRLVQQDLVRRLPTDNAAEYQANPILMPPAKPSTRESASEQE